MVYTTDYSSSASTQAGNAIAFGFALIFAVLLTFGYTIPLLVAYWKLFKKAGQPGWAAIVPIYSLWVQVKIARAPKWLFWVILLGGLLGFIPGGGLVSLGFSIYLIILTARQYDRPDGFWWLLYLLPIVGVFKVKDANYKTDGNVPPVAPAATAAVPPAGSVPPATPIQPAAPVQTAPAQPVPVEPTPSVEPTPPANPPTPPTPPAA